MKVLNQTKKALMLSIFTLVLCLGMLISTTYAWFTDSVSSEGNIIQTGKLDVKMQWADGKESPAAATWKDVEGTNAEPIFNNNKWEPGYVEVRHIKISNEGTLALKYQVLIKTEAAVSKLAEVIDVYYTDPAVQVTDRAVLENLPEENKLGTLKDVLANLGKTGAGELKEGEKDVITLALKMQENANNDYQDMSLGGAFTVQVLATQLEAEEDSFGSDYDEGAYLPIVYTAAELKSALENGASVKLGADITLDEPIVIPAATTTYSLRARAAVSPTVIDLNGKNIIASERAIVNNGNLEINGEGTIDISSSADQKVQVIDNYGTLTINGGKYIGAKTLYSYAIRSAGALIINQAVVEGGFGGIAVQSGSSAIINDGKFTNCMDEGAHVIIVWEDATLEINGGSFEGHQQANNYYQYAVIGVGNASVVINDGNFVAQTQANSNKLLFSGTDITVKGGTFDVDPKNYVYEGHEVVKNTNGTWTVEPFISYNKEIMGNLYDYLSTLERGDILVLPEQTYITSGTFTIPDGVTIKGAEGAEVIIRQISSEQDNIFNCEGDAIIENITFESNRKGYAISGSLKEHNGSGDIIVRNCKFVGLAADKNWAVYKNLNGDLIIENCTFDNYNNAICGVNNGEGSVTVITGCTFTNINGEAIGYVSSTLPTNFEDEVIQNNTGLTEENVISY